MASWHCTDHCGSGNALKTPDFTLSTATPLGDWTLASKIQWKPYATGADGWMPATCFVGGSCKLDGGSKLRLRASHLGKLGLSYSTKAPRDKLAIAFSAETSVEDMCGLVLPRLGISLKWGG